MIGGVAARERERPRMPQPTVEKACREKRPPHLHLSPPLSLQADFGDTLLAVSAPAWDPASSPALTWGPGDEWMGAVAVPKAGSAPVEFKLVLAKADGSLVWEDGPNRLVDVPAVEAPVCVTAAWGAPGATVVEVEEEAEEEADAPTPPVLEATGVSFAPAAAAAAMVDRVVAAVAPPRPAPAVVEEEEEEAAAVVVVEEEVAAAAVAVAVAVAPAVAEEAAPVTTPTPLAQTVLNLAAGATAVGFGALVASALAVDVGEVAAVSALAAAGAAAMGSRDPETAAKLKSVASAGASAAGGFAAGAESLLRAAGLKSFKEQEAEAAEAEAAAAAEEEEE